MDPCTPILAGVASGTCCPEAGITAIANATIKSKCRCTFMTTSPSWFCPARPSGKNSTARSEIRLLRSRDRKQIVAEAVVVVLGADELPPVTLLFAPARHHIHRLVERVLVLDLDQDFEEFPICRQLVTLRHAELFGVRRAEHVDEGHLRGQADRINNQLAVLVTADRFAEPGRLHVFRVLVGQVDSARERVAL